MSAPARIDRAQAGGELWRGGIRLRSMFFFFSNRVGLAGSILLSLLVSLVLLYACSHV
jgi:hypothetical protein